MSRTPNKAITTLIAVLATAVLAPAASAASTGPSERTQTELGQAVGEPADQASGAANARYSRTATELAQQGSAAANAKYSRTPTELGQSAPATVAPDVEPVGGFDWGDAGIGAGAMLGLIGLGGSLAVVLVNRRRHEIGDSRVPAVSS